jgi:hypothetical protein
MIDTRHFATKVTLILFLIGPTVALAKVNHRPVEDFTSAQVNVIGWINSNNPLFVGVIDFGGVINRFLVANNCGQPDLGTTFSGDIIETALPDGTTQVHLVLHGKNAFMRAFLESDGTPVLGYTRAEVCGGAMPTLGEFLLTVDFINNQGLGGPLPDLLNLLFAPEPGQVFQGILVNATVQGPLRFLPGVQAGTPGFMHVLQRGPYVRGKGVPGHDYFPAELVNVKAQGQ